MKLDNLYHLVAPTTIFTTRGLLYENGLPNKHLPLSIEMTHLTDELVHYCMRANLHNPILPCYHRYLTIAMQCPNGATL